MLKSYQIEALDWLEKFFKRCKESGNPRESYAQATLEWRDIALPYHPLSSLEKVPYVCVRIPTGGGKTLVGGMAIERVNRSLLEVPFSLTLWLVPSEPIREQTLKALRDKSTLLCRSMATVLGDFTVLDIDEAIRVTPHVLNGSNTIIVATMQAFKQEDTGRLNVYKENGYLMEHFNGQANSTSQGYGSLVDVLRLRHPFVIVDEAHNQGTPLAFDTLARFEPCAILELTATPDRTWQPSNVLFSVSASVLHSEDMIKMPINLVQRPNWMDALRDAIACLNELQQQAETERLNGGTYLRPVMLIQAERKDANHETLVPEHIKKALIDDYNLPAQEIAIATGAVDEIDGINILAEDCPLRFVITVDKLREGWDCPFAYVLCSLRNTSSATAAEQILGRILRLPHAYKKKQPGLNMAYAYLTSTNFAATVESLKDGLVRNGFERQETKDLIHTPDLQEENDLLSQQMNFTYSAPEFPEPADIPNNLTKKIEITPENGTITLKGSFTDNQKKILKEAFKTPDGKNTFELAISRMHQPRKMSPPSPSEQGELFVVPVLQYRQADLWEQFDDTHLLQGSWRLLDYSAELPNFSKSYQKIDGGSLYVDKDAEKIKFTYFNEKTVQQVQFDYHSGWTHIDMVSWLERNIHDETILPDEKAAFLNKAVEWLLSSNFTLDELIYDKYRLRTALEDRIASAESQAMRQVYQSLLLNQEDFIVNDQSPIIFEQGRYAYDFIYSGFVNLPNHFYPQIGNLKSTGEEYECALFLATQLERIKFWVRNVERKKMSFSLQTASDKFYPDFLCKMENDTVLAIEYKNSRDWDLPENIEKRQIGELWERRSNGKCFFIMPRGKDFEEIRRKAQEALLK